MKFDLVLFDADDTLFDFAKGERLAFAAMLDSIGVSASPDIFETYCQINRGLWAQLEKNQITKDYLMVERYRQLFKVLNHDGNPQAVGDHYLALLSQQHHLLEGALELVLEIKKFSRIGIVTNGVEFVQRRRLELSELRHHIELMIVSDECGFQKPDARIFDHALDRASHIDRKSVLMVGDRLDTDILGGMNAGIATCWFNPAAAPNDSSIHPDFEVRSLGDILAIGR